MANLVAFIDILGTKARIKEGRFSAIHLLEFVNPVAFAARENPDFRFAAFSDCVIVSADSSLAHRFVAVISYLLRNWFEEDLLVRGGVALGEIDWIDHPAADELFRHLPNCHYARVYGKALVEAFDLQERSGPGSICFLSDEAARLLADSSASYVFTGILPMLVWLDREQASCVQQALERDLNGPGGHNANAESRRQRVATLNAIRETIRAEKFLPDHFGLTAISAQ